MVQLQTKLNFVYFLRFLILWFLVFPLTVMQLFLHCWADGSWSLEQSKKSGENLMFGVKNYNISINSHSILVSISRWKVALLFRCRVPTRTRHSCQNCFTPGSTAWHGRVTEDHWIFKIYGIWITSTPQLSRFQSFKSIGTMLCCVRKSKSLFK